MKPDRARVLIWADESCEGDLSPRYCVQFMNDFWLIFVPRVGVHPGGKALEETLARPFLTDPVAPFVLYTLVALWLLVLLCETALATLTTRIDFCRVLVACLRTLRDFLLIHSPHLARVTIPLAGILSHLVLDFF